MEKIEKEIKVTRYVAFDSTEFCTEAECRHYEGSAFGGLLQQLAKCTLGAYQANGRMHYFLCPKTRHDIFVIEQILKMAGWGRTCGFCYDHLTILSVKLRCNIVTDAEVRNLEDLIADITNGQFAVVCATKPEERK